MRRTTTETRHGTAAGVAATREQVACCVSSSEARQVATAVVRRSGGDAVAMQPRELRTALRDGGPWAALIHDLNPWDGEVVAQVVRSGPS
jgi:hypothetical protein